MERLLQDIRFGARLLWKDRTFALTSLLTLALCIGANASIFTVVHSVLLRPLPIPGAERLVLFFNSYPRAGVERAATGVPDYYDRLREIDVVEEQALYNTRGVTIGIAGDPQRVTAMLARPSLLRMLGVTPVQGRIFREEEGERGQDRKVILTRAYADQIFGVASSPVGRELRINGEPYEIVGVLPAAFRFLNPEIRLWMPLAFSVQERSDDSRHSNNWSMLARLKPGATIQQAQQQVDALNARNNERFPQFREILVNAGFRTVATSFQDDLVQSVRPTLFLLWGGVLFVLLIGAVNVTNLVLVRSTARMKELATRHALGAGLSRLTRQLLTETVLLTLAGGAAGLLLGYWGVTLLTGLGIDRLPRGYEVAMGWTAVAFTAGLALAVGALIGLVPILNMRHMNLSQAFREESRSGTSGRRARAARRALVACQVGFAFMLLVGAGLLYASFERVLAIDPGFDPDRVLTARVAPPASRYPENKDHLTFQARLLERVRAIPGVRSAGITSNLPFGGDYSDGVILAEGYQMAPGESLISPYRVVVSPGYFESMGIEPKSGRLFTESDTSTSPRVVIVDEKLARRFWPGKDPIGRRMFRPDNPEDLTKPGPKAIWLTVVGVVPEVRISGFISTDDRPGAYYFPSTQDVRRSVTLVVKGVSDPSAFTPLIRRELAAIDPELPLYGVLTMQDRMDASLADRRTPMTLALVFAGVALFLAAVGLYGVLAYQVTQRTREIGIRIALGSDARGVFTLVLGEGLVLLATGLALGFAGAFAIRRTMQTQLYGIGAMDPIVVGSVAAVLGAVAVLACTVPARRASRIDPLIALSQQ